MKRLLLRFGLGPVLALALAGVVAQAAASRPFDHPWSGTGSGTTTVVSDGTTAPAVFTYSQFGNPSFGADGAWSFSTVATSTRTVTLAYDYSGFHAFFRVTVGLDAFVTHGGTTTTTPLVNDGPVNCCTPPSGGFAYSGTVSLSVQAGDTYGFAMRGSNRDLNPTLQGTLTVDEPCTETVSGTVSAPLQIGAGVTCISGGTIAGPVSISAGAVVVLTGATIYGPLTAESAAQIEVCDSTIAGQVSITGTSGPVLIGSAGGGTPACGGNDILGPVTLTGNTGGVELGANTIAGPTTVTGNSGPAITIGANTVYGPLLCSANNPDPTNNNNPNTVHGPASGQCATLG